MPRVAKDRRLRRQARLARRSESFQQLARTFVEFMAERGIAGTVSCDGSGVTITGGTEHLMGGQVMTGYIEADGSVWTEEPRC